MAQWCEALVRLVSDPQPDRPKRGDVIVICPAGWKWSKGDLGNGRRMVVTLHGDVRAHDPLMAPGIGWYRAVYVDLDDGNKVKARPPRHAEQVG